MRILPFRNRFGVHQNDEVHDWSQQELADFYRAHRLLVENGVGIGMDRGISDTGDPWVAFYDAVTQDVFMHVARIDRSCVLICETFGLRLSSSNIADLIAAFEREVQSLLRLRQERNANVVLHPAARIIISISAIFLMFKLENGGAAHAKGGTTDIGAADHTLRKHDAGSLARAQTVLARLYDAIDNPAAVAALAGVILSFELANLSGKPTEPELPAAEHHLSAPPIEIDHVVEQDVHSDVVDSTAAAEKHVDPEIAAVAENARHLPEVVEITVASTMPAAQTPAVYSSATVNSAPAIEVQQVASVVVSGTTVTPSQPSSINVDETALGTLAAKAVQAVIPHAAPTANTAPTASAPLPAEDGKAIDHGAVETLDQSVGEITVETLAAIDSIAGLVKTTQLAGAELNNTIDYLITAFGSYEVEAAGGHWLIEQENVASLDGDDLGIWTNVMADGSEVSVVGQIDLIDKATSVLA